MLVTGVASLVGARLAERLIADGNEVVGVDDLSSGSWELVRDLRRTGRFLFVEEDVTRALPRGEFGAIHHLALPSSRRRCAISPVGAMLAGVLGTARVLELAAARGVRVVVGTSVERWGDGVRCAESLVAEYVRGTRALERRVDVRIVRVGEAFGPRTPLDDDGVVTRLVLGLSPASDATSHRLTYVEDAVASLLLAMEHPVRLPPLLAPTFDVTREAVLAAVRGEPPPAPSDRWPGSGTRPTVPETMPASLVVGQEHALAFEEAIACTREAIAARLARWGLCAYGPTFVARNARNASTRVSTPKRVQVASPNDVTPTSVTWPPAASSSAGPPESPKQVLRVRSP